MKVILALLPFFLINCSKGVTSVAAGTDPVYAVGVSFNSICCGPPSDGFLKSFMKEFTKAHTVKITAVKIAGCGREGEFVVLFGLSKMKEAAKNKFIAELENLIPVQEAANKKASTSSGGLALLHDVKESDYNHCRIKPLNWEY
jgi:hypothetical protein